jgi:hypothetical protein
MRTNLLLIAAAAAACLAGAGGAPAQSAKKPPAATQPGPTSMPTSRPVAPLEYPSAALLTPTGRERLAAERLMFQRELENNASYDPDDLKKVCEALHKGALDTPADNVVRFAKALAALQARGRLSKEGETFEKGWELYVKGQWAEAAKAWEPLMREKVGIKQRYKHDTMAPLSYTTTKFLWAECVGRGGDMKATVVGYQVVFEKLPDSFTFAAMAGARAAAIYEETDRPHVALPMHRNTLIRFGDCMIDRESMRLAEKVQALAAVDPYRVGARKAAEVYARLARQDGGKPTQKAQEELMGMLEQMMMLAMDEDRPFLERSQAIVLGAETGKLEAGGVDKIDLSGEDAPKVGSDDWGKLRPREQQELLEAFYGTFPERYRGMLQAYYRNIAEAAAANGGGGNGGAEKPK